MTYKYQPFRDVAVGSEFLEGVEIPGWGLTQVIGPTFAFPRCAKVFERRANGRDASIAILYWTDNSNAPVDIVVSAGVTRRVRVLGLAIEIADAWLEDGHIQVIGVNDVS